MHSLKKTNLKKKKIKELMVGRKLTGNYYRSDYDGSFQSEVVLSAKQIYKSGILEDVNIELHKGEILGIGGLTDCGMHDLGRILFGIEKPMFGKSCFKGWNRG